MNIFQKIGNNIEKDKKRKQDFDNKYWSLKSVERIDYDNHIGKINRDTELKFSNCLTWFITKIILFIMILLFFIGFYKEISIINLIRLLIGAYFGIIFWIVLLDIFIFFRVILDRGKMVEKLNRRFKLC